jgi:hypothetical protein
VWPRGQLFDDLLLDRFLLVPLEAECRVGGAVEEVEGVLLDLLLRRFVFGLEEPFALAGDDLAGFVVVVEDLLGDVDLELVDELGAEQVDVLLVEVFVDELVELLRGECEELDLFLAERLAVEVALDDVLAQLAGAVFVDQALDDGAEADVVAGGAAGDVFEERERSRLLRLELLLCGGVPVDRRVRVVRSFVPDEEYRFWSAGATRQVGVVAGGRLRVLREVDARDRELRRARPLACVEAGSVCGLDSRERRRPLLLGEVLQRVFVAVSFQAEVDVVVQADLVAHDEPLLFQRVGCGGVFSDGLRDGFEPAQDVSLGEVGVRLRGFRGA